MSIKRIFIVISAIFAVSAVFADNSSVTSKKYVDDLMSGYQGKLPGSGANTLMIYDDETGIGEKSIAATLGNSASAASVPTVGAVKTGLDGKQDTITGTAGYVMTGTGNPGEVGAKPIYSANTNYSDSLVTAETVNTGVINAVNNSLIRVDENGAPSDSGTLWEINTSLFAINASVPYGYTELQYVVFNGDQYIDTGYIMNKENYPKVEITFSDKNITTSAFGAQHNNTRSFVDFGGQVYCGDGARRISYSVSGTGQHVLKASFDSSSSMLNIFVDGVRTGGATQTGSFPTDTTFWIGRINGGGSSVSPLKATVYGVKIYENELLIRNFVPAKNSSGVVGMYDTVSGTFFPDAAGGNFTAGPSCISPNLFDKNNTTVLNLGITASDGVGYYSTNSARYGVAVKVNPNTTYTWSFNRGTQSAYINFGESADYPTNGGACSYVGIGTSSSTYTFTTKSTTNYVYFYTTDTSFVNTMQLEQGSTATTYRPYGENICD